MTSVVCRSTVLASTLLCAASIALGGCVTDDEPAGQPSPSAGTGGSSDGTGGGSSHDGPPDGMGMIRVVHASPDAPAVDIYAEGLDDALISGLSYGETSEYLVVEPGDYNIQLCAAPSTSSGPVAYATGTLTIEEGETKTSIAAGLLASSEPADKFRVLTLTEDYDAAGTGNAIVRVVHAGSDAPSFLDVWRSAPRFDPAVATDVAFVATMARRRLIDRRRSRSRRPDTETFQDPPTIQDDAGAGHIENCGEAMLANKALSLLRPEQRTVLLLAACHGRSHEEISGTTGMPLGTVKAHARRGLIRVRELLSNAPMETTS